MATSFICVYKQTSVNRTGSLVRLATPGEKNIYIKRKLSFFPPVALTGHALRSLATCCSLHDDVRLHAELILSLTARHNPALITLAIHLMFNVQNYKHFIVKQSVAHKACQYQRASFPHWNHDNPLGAISGDSSFYHTSLFVWLMQTFGLYLEWMDC